ncbi:MAG: hypothetical protein K0V04_10160 [Deltaproteobacteria bacterium]|nr:hypothetical protein [Deltaproteobacteria bacterium]
MSTTTYPLSSASRLAGRCCHCAAQAHSTVTATYEWLGFDGKIRVCRAQLALGHCTDHLPQVREAARWMRRTVLWPKLALAAITGGGLFVAWLGLRMAESVSAPVLIATPLLLLAVGLLTRTLTVRWAAARARRTACVWCCGTYFEPRFGLRRGPV